MSARTAEELIQGYRHSLLAAGRGMGTIKQRVLHMRNLAVFHPELLAVTLEDLEVLQARYRHTKKPETRRSERNSYRGFYGWAVRNKLLEESPAELLSPVFVPRTQARRAPDDLVQRALQTASLEEKAMILLARFAALRLSEIATLHMSAREGDLLRILGKGQKERIVPVNPDLMEVLVRLEHKLGGDGYYFPGRFSEHLHPQSMNKIITRRLGMNPHSLRHAAATSAYQGTGGDIRSVQEFLGHASPVTTQRYVHIGMDQIRAAAAATSLTIHDPSANSARERVA